MKKFFKNKFLVLIISVIIVSGGYIAGQKAIDNYFFEGNEDIVSEGGQISEDEVNLELGEDGDREETQVNESVEVQEEKAEYEEEESESIESAEWNGTHGKSNGSEDEEDLKKIYIYVTGEVNIPGVVILNEGSRIVDAINAAGGTTSNADISKVNLVYVLSDGMKVNIPNSSDLENNHNFEYITMNSANESNDDFVIDRGEVESNDSGSEYSGSSSGSSNNKVYSVVNINTATQTELESLPGIGPSLALNIINYRKENGKFSSIEDIKNVSGIGDARFENLKKYIKV